MLWFQFDWTNKCNPLSEGTFRQQLLILRTFLFMTNYAPTTVGVGQNGGSLLSAPDTPDNFFQLFFRSIIPYWAGNVSKKLRPSEFIVYAVVYTCTDPGNLTFRNFLPFFCEYSGGFLLPLLPPPLPDLFFNVFLLCYSPDRHP